MVTSRAGAAGEGTETGSGGGGAGRPAWPSQGQHGALPSHSKAVFLLIHFWDFLKLSSFLTKRSQGSNTKPMTKNTKHNVRTHQCVYQWKHQRRGLSGPCPAWAAGPESGLRRNLKIRRCLTSTLSSGLAPSGSEMASLYTSPEPLQVLESPLSPPSGPRTIHILNSSSVHLCLSSSRPPHCVCACICVCWFARPHVVPSTVLSSKQRCGRRSSHVPAGWSR